MIQRAFLTICAVAFLSTLTWNQPLLAGTVEQNKAVVTGFYELAFVKQKPDQAVKKFVGPKYIQHHPFVGDGTGPFLSYFGEHYRKNPKATTSIKRVIAEGDLVVVHAHSKDNEQDLGVSAIDIFRVEDGESANSDTMF